MLQQQLPQHAGELHRARGLPCLRDKLAKFDRQLIEQEARLLRAEKIGRRTLADFGEVIA